MNIAKYINRIALIYTVVSVIIGPGLVFIIAAASPGPIGDCGDIAWGRAGFEGFNQIGHVIRHYFLIIQLSEGVMFCIGAIIVGLLIAHHRKSSAGLLFGTLFMMLCYACAVLFFGIAKTC